MKLYYPDYKRSILNVSNSLLQHYGIKPFHSTLPELDNELTEDINHIVYILLDGMGVNVIKEHLSENDVLRKHMKHEITSVYPPTTVAATNSVMSGRTPIETGYIAWVQYLKDKDANAIVFQNKDFYTQEPLGVCIQDDYLPYENIFDMVGKIQPDVTTNIFFPKFIGGCCEALSDMSETVLLTLHNTDKSLSYMYWVEPDLTEHQYGTYSDETKKVVQDINKDITELVNNVPDNTLVIIIADHGLVNVKPVHFFDYPDVTECLVRNPSLEPRVATFFVKEGMHEIFEERFNKHFGDKFKLYTTEECLKAKPFGEGTPHPFLDDVFGDFIAVATDIYMFQLHVGKEYKAHHAGLSKEEMIVPLFLYKK